MNVFVLGTGRTGTTTFIEACGHLTNYTSGHETRVRRLGRDRFKYPDNHIEADNRLSWMLGQLHQEYKVKDTLYVYLKRNRDEVAHSYLKRWNNGYRAGIITAFGHGIVMKAEDWTEEEKLEVCKFYVDTVNYNVTQFLKDKPSMTMYLEAIRDTFPEFLDRINAEGDIKAAMAEWDVKHNASKN